VARDFHTALGATLSFDGATRTVVGIVENPRNLDDEFALAAPDTFTPQFATVLLSTPDAPHGGVRVDVNSRFAVEGRGRDENSVPAAVVLMLAAVMLVLVGLAAPAGFAVVAHRRQRQLGMLASLGATDAQMRLVMVSNGAAVGVAAGVAGVLVATPAWFVAHR